MTGAMSEALAKSKALLGTWGAPPDLPANIAIIVAAFALLAAISGRGRAWLGAGDAPVSRRIFLALTAAMASFLSLFWIAFYLRGGPRIIDATTYFLEGRAFAEGHFTWPVIEPTASFRGRFLLYDPSANADVPTGTMGGIFPPGYPLLLAIGFALRAPMVIGPLIAGALVVATYRLAHTLAERTQPIGCVEPIARSAALLSLVSAALRYHTADTMSHGATALGIVLAFDSALRRRFGLAGLAIGAVLATRPVSSFAIGLVSLAWLLRVHENRAKSLLRLAIGALPGIALLLVWQKALTGSWFTSPQRMYYALSDGPPGCFRWGFGASIGCLHEHGEFVRARLPHGYGVLEALGVTHLRLRMHLTDIANFEPLAFLVLVPLARPKKDGARESRDPAVIASVTLVALHMLAYAPFYFDGSYPGGGARFFADVLPIEHALIALAIARLAGARVVRGSFAVLALALVGFALHASFGHKQLADRDGGRPMFEPDVLARANVATGLVFVDTDHGFALGHDPDARPESGLLIARLHNDARDRLLYDRLDRPPAYLYHFDRSPSAHASVSITAWTPPPSGDTFRFEAEAEWPVLGALGGFAAPAYGEACASGGRALVLTKASVDKPARATISVPVPESGRYSVVPRVADGTRVPYTHVSKDVVTRATLHLHAAAEASPVWSWTPVDHGCVDLAAQETELRSPSVELVIETTGAPVALDKITLRKIH